MSEDERRALARRLSWLGRQERDPRLSGTYQRLAEFYARRSSPTTH